MSKKAKAQAAKSGQRGKGATVSRGSRVQRVSPISERIIKETSVKWRKAIEILADS